MSLRPEDKKELAESAYRLAKIIVRLESSFTDPRTMDILEIAISLIEDQLHSDIKYQPIQDYDEDEDEMLNINMINLNNEAELAQEEVEDVEDDNISPEELRDWYDLPSYGEDNDFRE